MAIVTCVLLTACVVMLVVFFKKHTELVTAYRVVFCVLSVVFLLMGTKDSGEEKKTKVKLRIAEAYMIGCLALATAFVFLTFSFVPLNEVVLGNVWPVPRDSSAMYIVVGLLSLAAFIVSFIKRK
ncbi:MAG: hypothetical protein Q8O30_00015 [Candidatus Omnitrophota bacterium]|nr:hypothetical protein [Candidatus Omnitrophota bacterium]